MLGEPRQVNIAIVSMRIILISELVANLRSASLTWLQMITNVSFAVGENHKRLKTSAESRFYKTNHALMQDYVTACKIKHFLNE